jgi:hypothetical protein
MGTPSTKNGSKQGSTERREKRRPHGTKDHKALKASHAGIIRIGF